MLKLEIISRICLRERNLLDLSEIGSCEEGKKNLVESNKGRGFIYINFLALRSTILLFLSPLPLLLLLCSFSFCPEWKSRISFDAARSGRRLIRSLARGFKPRY